jgi:hypothetical protein
MPLGKHRLKTFSKALLSLDFNLPSSISSKTLPTNWYLVPSLGAILMKTHLWPFVTMPLVARNFAKYFLRDAAAV